MIDTFSAVGHLFKVGPTRVKRFDEVEGNGIKDDVYDDVFRSIVLRHIQVHFLTVTPQHSPHFLVPDIYIHSFLLNF